MTLASTVCRNDYIGNGSASSYSYAFVIFAATDLVVSVTSNANPPVESLLVLGTDYSVTDVQNINGGNVNLINSGQAWLNGSGDLLSGYQITIRRVRPLTQTTDIRNQGAFYPDVIEMTFDELVMITQQLQEELGRAVLMPVAITPSNFDPTLPDGFENTPGSFPVINSDQSGWTMQAPVNQTAGTWAQEVPSGTVNGTNVAFVLANTPFTALTVMLFLSGRFLIQGVDYTISGSTITMTVAPAVGQSLAAAYQH